VVTPFLHVDGRLPLVKSLDDHDVANRWGTFQRFIRHLLERNDRPSPPAAVGGNQHVALRIVDAIAERVGAEPAEHH
jgi:hypothetical protein